MADWALTLKHHSPLRQNTYSVMHWEEGSRQKAGLGLVQLGPQGFIIPFIWGASERNSSEFLAWVQSKRGEALMHF